MSIKHRVKDRSADGKMRPLFLDGPGVYTRDHTRNRWFSTAQSPGHWIREFMTRPRRRKNRQLCHLVMSGRRDPDGVAWPLEKKPHIYYY